MQYVKLGRTGLEVSRICLGCMSYGPPIRATMPGALTKRRAALSSAGSRRGRASISSTRRIGISSAAARRSSPAVKTSPAATGFIATKSMACAGRDRTAAACRARRS